MRTEQHGVRAVGVVVPARDEQDDVLACLRSVRAALARLPTGTPSAVTVVLDRCSDRTPELVAAELDGWPGAAALRVAALGGRRAGTARTPAVAHIVAGRGVGAVRDLGIRATLRRLRAFAPHDVWLLNTDADTTVPPDWALAHLREARAGASGVAGTAELRSAGELSPVALQRYRALVAAGLTRSGHRHVYGANLGVRADAYLAVGGFPPDCAGEDHGLWSRLRVAGHPLAAPRSPAVRTSPRLQGRAAGGLAALLRSLNADENGSPPGTGPDRTPGGPGRSTAADTPDGA
jgi:cellulose synthase/poly-beta-1,6-N-acetylglucosamine synthase-like glycosyltransferase